MKKEMLLLIFAVLVSLDAKVEECFQENGKQKCKLKQDKPIVLQKPPAPVLLWWYDDVFPHNIDEGKTQSIICPNGKTCLSSCDRNLKSEPTTSAFIFYGTAFSANDLPLPRTPSHIWALMHEESPKNNWLFSHEDGISIFNYTATFSRESNYPLATQFIVDLNDWVTSIFFVSTEDKNKFRKTGVHAPAVFLQRDCNPPSDRDRYVRELMTYMDIDSYGPCENNKRMPPNVDGFHKLDDEEFYRFLANYKFHISFENAICKDYMTEKLFRPLQIGVVPVYMGSSHAFEFMPNNHSAIFVDDFENPKELANYLLELDRDDSKYNEYLRHHIDGIENDWLVKTMNDRKWKYFGQSDKVNFIHRMFAGFECDLCDFVIERNHAKNHKSFDLSTDDESDERRRRGVMRCPEPIASLPKWRSNVDKSSSYWEGLHEAQAVNDMLISNETDSKNFESKYLKRKTDKYP